MRKLGHDVRFVVNTHERLDRPESRYSEILHPYPDWICEVALPNPIDWIHKSKRADQDRVVEFLRNCDWVVANQLGCSLLKRIGRPALAWLTGVDLLVYCNWWTAEKKASQTISRTPLRRWLRAQINRFLFLRLILRQRTGVGDAKLIRFYARGLFPDGDFLLDSLGVTESRRKYLRMTDTDTLMYCEPPSNVNIRIFCGARLNWVRPIPDGWCEMDYKGTDIMVRGLGLHFRKTGRRLDIRLVRKGLHVIQTTDLLEKEGLIDQVTWCEELDQKSYFDECRNADIVFDQLGASITGMVTLEAMALGRPVIANGRIDLLDGPWVDSSPLCQASTEEEVCAQLAKLVPDAVLRRDVGLASRRFVEEYFSADAAAQFCIKHFSEYV